jgi:hypothetical protein
MADASPPPPLPAEGRKTLTWVILAIVLLLVIYLVYRCGKTPVPPPDVEPTPAVTEVVTGIPTVPAAPTATRTPMSAIAACLPPAPTPTPRCENTVILIGPDAATVNPEYACVGPENWVRWRAWDGQSRLKIYFPKSGFPEGLNQGVSPFPDMTLVKDDWVFNHTEKSTTYAPKPSVFGSAGQKYCFKYDQELNGVRKDGRIIIQR